MQKMMITMKSIVTFVNYVLVTLWHILQTIIDGVITYAPIVYNFTWDFTEALYNRDYDDDEPVSQKTPLIDKTWCNIDPNNIIEDEDKKKM